MRTADHTVNPAKIGTVLSAVILSGGRGSRLQNRDKGTIGWEGKPLIAVAVDKLLPLTSSLFISCNRNTDFYQQFNLPLLQDKSAGFQGPLAGVASALQIVARPLLLVWPVDCPKLPARLAEILANALLKIHPDKEAAAFILNGRPLPLPFIMRSNCRNKFVKFFPAAGQSVHAWLQECDSCFIQSPVAGDCFLNINRETDLGKGCTQ